LTGHLDVNPGGVPTLLNMWLGSHYGGSSLSVAQDETWTKLVGPMLIYCNAATNHEVMWKEALARAESEAKRWPYTWVSDPNYPTAAQRGVVSGKIVLRDSFEPDAKMSNVWVGVTAPDYSTRAQRSGGRGGFPSFVDWQRDSKFYQFWTQADVDGRFTIRNVRPGNYTLHAIADGVLGEFTLTNLTVATAENKSLGKLAWQPQRFGKTLWQIGVPDRTAREFRHGDHYWQWGLYFQYAKEFPKDVNFVIGRSDWRKDWNYVQPPRIENQNVAVVGEEDENNAPARAGRGQVRDSTWKIQFDLPDAPRGKATLRLAFCGTHAGCEVEISVNDKFIGTTGPLPSTSAMQRDGIRAYWIEKDLSFNASQLQRGTNVIKLRSYADSWSQGVMYDCVRLELDDGVKSSSAATR
jgi:rhamnogalacturonan endolyase